MGCALVNVIILLSYKQEEKEVIEIGGWQTEGFIVILGMFNLIFSSLVVFLFFVKRAPLLAHHLWDDFFKAIFERKIGII